MTDQQPDTRVPGLISVVIPAYNAAALISETIDSVLAQTYSAIEIIVVDDGSSDDTAQVVGRYGSSVMLLSQSNSGGCSSPRNHGLRVARGEFVTFFDADDIMCGNKLSLQHDFLGRNPSASIVLMDYRNFDDDGPAPASHFEQCSRLRAALRESARPGLLEPDTAMEILITENFGIAGSPLFRAAFLDRDNAFDEELRASEDFDLIYRSARRSSIGIIDEVGFLRRVHDMNMSNRTAHILRFKIASRAKLLRDEMHPSRRILLRRAIADYHLSLAEFLGRRSPGSVLHHTWGAFRSSSTSFPVRMLKCLLRSASGLFARA